MKKLMFTGCLFLLLASCKKEELVTAKFDCNCIVTEALALKPWERTLGKSDFYLRLFCDGWRSTVGVTERDYLQAKIGAPIKPGCPQNQE
jgi:hypothetical protein